MTIPTRPSPALEESISLTQFLFDTALSGLRKKQHHELEQAPSEDVQDVYNDDNIVTVEHVRVRLEHLVA